MSKPKILVTASTGNFGLPLSKALHEKGIPFTAATRNAEMAFEKFGFEKDIAFISTGGSASLTLIKGETLPAIEYL